MKNIPNDIAVITGDIVGSSKMDAERRLILYQTFPLLSKRLGEIYPNAVKYRISNFRGDGWQIVVNSPEKAVEISLYIRTYIRFTFQDEKLDTRIAIGIGPVQFIPEDNVSAGDGPAYLTSGRLLETMADGFMGIDFSSASKDNLLFDSLVNLVGLLDVLVTSWGPGHSQAVNLALQGLLQKEIASTWWPDPIKQPSVSKSLQIAGWSQVKSSLLLMERLIAAQLKDDK